VGGRPRVKFVMPLEDADLALYVLTETPQGAGRSGAEGGEMARVETVGAAVAHWEILNEFSDNK
jgi:hypothetical protein